MKTENTETLNTTNGELAEVSRLTRLTKTQLTPRLSRLSAACLNKWNDLKERLSSQLAAEYGGAIDQTLVRQAINEADALAATTHFPSLFLPTLAEQKVQLAYAWSSHQRAIHEQSLALAA